MVGGDGPSRSDSARLRQRERDELTMTPRYGRAPRGQPAIAEAPRNHGPNATFLAALSGTGPASGGIARRSAQRGDIAVGSDRHACCRINLRS